MEGKHVRVIVIGAGIIGAAIAHKLSRAGADVVIFDAGHGGATAASFGWINASFYLDDHHFALRTAGIEAWRSWGIPVSWSACLCWEAEGSAFDAQRDDLTARGYAVEEIDADRFATLEPHVAAPARALRFASEGVADPVGTTQHILRGLKVVRGVAIEGIATQGDNVTGVQTANGFIAADRVVVAAGTASPELLEPLDVALPLLDRPGVMMRTAAVPQCLSHVLATPELELRQDKAGYLWAPTAAQHQGDATHSPETHPNLLADRAMDHVRALLPEIDVGWEQVMLAARPMPQDERPAFGPCGPDGLFAAVMHSGVTLAAITADLMAAQVLDTPLSNAQADLSAPYALARFQSAAS